ncbi:MAG: hypothetical protein JWP22_569 [Ramlibacter sp.]|jgi:hypothetical protein|nr:hypothetical protein [Ramlibacter sp.]
MSDLTILSHISELVEEEKNLRADHGKPNHNAERLRHVEEQLDQCWDLLRQRRAKREFGENAETASVRDPRTVEGYIG